MLARDDNDLLQAGELPDDPAVGTVLAGPDGEPWTPPIPLDRSRSLPAFPVDALPSPLGEYVSGVATQLQVPVDLPAMLSLVVVGIAASRIEVMIREGYCEPHLGIFVIPVMRSGSRKSAAFTAMFRPLYRWERERGEELRPEITRARARAACKKKQYEAALSKGKIASVEQLSVELDAAQREVPTEPRFLTADCTPEKLATMLAEQGGRMGVASAESGVLSALTGGYSKAKGPNLDILLQGHAGDPIRVDRSSGRRDAIDDPMLSLALTAQPIVLEQMNGSPEMRGRGLLARCLIVMPRSLVGDRKRSSPAVPRDLMDRYENLLRGLLSDRAASEAEGLRRQTVRLSEDALQLLEDFADELEPRLREDSGDLAWIAPWVSKLPGAVARIAGLLHLVACSPGRIEGTIPADIVADAIRIGRYLLVHAQAAFSALGQDPETGHARLLLPYLARAPREFTARDLFQAAKGRSEFKRMEPVNEALAVLVEHDFVRPIEGERRQVLGRPPSPRYLRNPHWPPSQNPQNPQKPGR